MGRMEALENAVSMPLQSPPAGSAGMRDSPRSRTFRRPVPRLVAVLAASALAGGGVVLPAAGAAAGKKRSTLTLKSSLSKRMKRAQAAGNVLPFTIRLRRSYEG